MYLFFCSFLVIFHFKNLYWKTSSVNQPNWRSNIRKTICKYIKQFPKHILRPFHLAVFYSFVEHSNKGKFRVILSSLHCNLSIRCYAKEHNLNFVLICLFAALEHFETAPLTSHSIVPMKDYVIC